MKIRRQQENQSFSGGTDQKPGCVKQSGSRMCLVRSCVIAASVRGTGVGAGASETPSTQYEKPQSMSALDVPHG